MGLQKIEPHTPKSENPVRQTIEAIEFFEALNIDKNEKIQYGNRVTTINKEINNAREAQKCFLTWGDL